MKKIAQFAIYSLLAIGITACGSGDDASVNETIRLTESGSTASIEYKFPDESLYGTEYEIEISTNNYGVNIELSRIELCDNSTVPIKSYVKTCRITKDGILKIINPVEPGAGGDEVVTVKVKRKH
jgi:hypothetical protein